MKCRSIGTMLKQSTNLQNGSQNHPQNWKQHNTAHRMYRLRSLFSLTVEVLCVKRVHSWRSNSESKTPTVLRSTRSSSKETTQIMAGTQLVSLPWQHFCTYSPLLPESLTKNNTPVSLQPSHSPHHSPEEFFMFPKLKVSVKGHQFVISRGNTIKNCQSN